MKKTWFVLILILVSLFTYAMMPKETSIDEPVSKIMNQKINRYNSTTIQDLMTDPNDFNNFYLLFDSYQLTTSNINNLFTAFDGHEYKVREIYPYLNPLYISNLSQIEKISFDGQSLLEGIDNFYNNYINEMNKYNLDGEIEKAFAHGIKIRMMKIYTSNKALYDFLSLYSDIKYSLNKNGSFLKF